MKEHNEIDSLFESAFDGLTLTPDLSVKENIDQAIASKKKRRRFLFLLFLVLFSTMSLAVTIFLYPISEKTIQNQQITPEHINQKQSQLPLKGNKKANKDNMLLPITTETVPFSNSQNEKQNQCDESARFYSSKIKSEIRNSRNNHNPNQLSTIPTLEDRTKNKAPLVISDTPIIPNEVIQSQTGINRTDYQVTKAPEKQGNTTTIQEDTLLLAEAKQDSSLSNTPIPDLISNNSNNKQKGKWFLSLLTYWEGEKKRILDPPNGPFVNKKRETAVVHSSTFYGKIELNYQFARGLELLTGVGFRFSNIFQYGYAEKIKSSLQGLGSSIPNIPLVNDTILYRESKSFRINSILLPLGFGYSFPLGKKMSIRLSTGAEFAYGHLTQENFHKALSAPTLHSFGCSVWARPELSYSFGKIQLFGFGTYNQTLLQQVKWDFEVKRNPAFGGGIGFRVEI